MTLLSQQSVQEQAEKPGNESGMLTTVLKLELNLLVGVCPVVIGCCYLIPSLHQACL